MTDDAVTKAAYSQSNTGSPSLLCGVSNAESTEVPPGSSLNTFGSSSSWVSTAAHSKTHSNTVPRATFFVHYLRTRQSQKPTIHSLEFKSGDGLNSVFYVKQMAAAVLSHIYQEGYKRILIFISPKSGKGKGEEIVKRHILPILHFSRHAVDVHLTTRAHDCEDYVANISNALDGGTVVACAGGDGMIHEALNGLQRRKLALLKALREGGGNTGQPTTVTSLAYYFRHSKTVTEAWDRALPMVATIATGSACGLAKSLNVLHHTEAAISLINLRTCHMDLMNMKFIPNPELLSHNKARLVSGKHTKSAESGFCKYFEKHRREIEERDAERQNCKKMKLIDTTSPFLSDGTPEYRNPVSHYYGFPDFAERVAFMSLSFGMANDIDHGSEHLRFLGNNRFIVYGGYLILQGVRKYSTLLRYLPWESTSGFKVEKIHSNRKMPDTTQMPICTMNDSCPHCLEYAPRDVLSHASTEKEAATEDDSLIQLSRVDESDEEAPEKSLDQFTNAELLNEEEVDFDDESLPWVTIRGDFYNMIICNLRDVAQDMVMAPIAHLSDGAIDLVYSRVDPSTGEGGRKELVQFMTSLEKGKHVEYEFCHYVKARAVEIKVDEGISMSDGELMPMSTARITKIRQGSRLVRFDYE
ncbi:diacylglycerol kinase [Angomonas deanei]|nr:diacylglycerol kinase [Angomonas deanei]|eukprot:EPY24941.1 diacylglycerol kinase [Angomonas deanei]